MKLGRQTSTIHISLTQDGREEVVAYLQQREHDYRERPHATDGVVTEPAAPAAAHRLRQTSCRRGGRQLGALQGPTTS